MPPTDNARNDDGPPDNPSARPARPSGVLSPLNLEARPKPPWWRVALPWAIVILTVAGLTIALTSNAQALRDAFDRARSGGGLLFAATVLLPVLNWITTSCGFWLPTAVRAADPQHRVRAHEMLALIGCAWVLNHLPLRPGLVGRVAYHKRYNATTVRANLFVLVLNAAAMALGVTTHLAIVGLSAWANAPTSAAHPIAWALLLAPAAALALAAAPPHLSPRTRSLLATLAFRQLDFTLWVVRYVVVLELAQKDYSLLDATVLAGVSQAVLMMPLAGNGLGIREWAIGVVAPLLPALHSGSAFDAPILSAEVIHRAGEVIAAVPCGLLSLLVTHRLIARREAQRAATPTPPNQRDPHDPAPSPATPASPATPHANTPTPPA